MSNRKDRRGGRVADVGAVFYQVVATGLNVVEQEQGHAGANFGPTLPKFAGVAGEICYNKFCAVLFFLFAVGAGNNFPGCTAKSKPGRLWRTGRG